MHKTNFKGENYPIWFVYIPDQFVFVGQYLKTNQIQASVPLMNGWGSLVGIHTKRGTYGVHKEFMCLFPQIFYFDYRYVTLYARNMMFWKELNILFSKKVKSVFYIICLTD
jgi:hypothetical protein